MVLINITGLFFENSTLHMIAVMGVVDTFKLRVVVEWERSCNKEK